MSTRQNPFGAFNYIVSLGGAQEKEGTVIGGFSDVSGLGMEVKYSEYRNGNEKFNIARKIPNTHTVENVVCKRGLVGSVDLFAWLKGVRDGTADPRQVSITLLDEKHAPVVKWNLREAQPNKWSGPTLAAKGGAKWRWKRSASFTRGSNTRHSIHSKGHGSGAR